MSLLRAWAGEPATLNIRPKLKQRFKDDPSSGAVRGGPKSWHPWDNKRDVCKDGYEPVLGDLIICPRKNGDHIEFWIKRKGDLVTVSAGAQVGGVAQIRERDVNVSSFLGIIDISGLVTSEPF